MTGAARIPVVEDDFDVRDAVGRGLALNGFAPVLAEHAAAAWVQISIRRPDLIVLDVGLPGQSGIEFCSALRADGLDVPVLILSARDAVGDRIDGLSAGADDYVVKPFDLAEPCCAFMHCCVGRCQSRPPRRSLLASSGWTSIVAWRRSLEIVSTSPAESSTCCRHLFATTALFCHVCAY